MQYPQVQIHLRGTNRGVDRVENGIDIALRMHLWLRDSGSLVVKNLGSTNGQ